MIARMKRLLPQIKAASAFETPTQHLANTRRSSNLAASQQANNLASTAHSRAKACDAPVAAASSTLDRQTGDWSSI